MILKDYKRIICATTSPRRIKLLKESFSRIKFVSPVYKEKKIKYFFLPVLLCKYHAYKKTKGIKYKADDVVMGFDTIVYKNFKIYGKPANQEEAAKYIKELSNKTHKVITGAYIKYKNKTWFFHEVSEVKFKKLSDKKIRDYIAVGEWTDKAGGYGIQGVGKELIQWHRGDYYNIVGIPLDMVLKLFK